MRWTSWARTTELRRRARKVPEMHSSRSRHRAGLSLAGVFGLCFLSIAGAQRTPTPSVTTPRPTTSLPASRSNPQPPARPSSPPNVPTATEPRAPQPRFVVLLDPAHGGTNNGAILGAAGMEKNYVLALAVRLRALLNRRDIRTIMTRDGDTSLDNTARAEIANRTNAAACILLHASQTGNGVHLFTSSLPVSTQPDPRRTFLPWQTAQAAYGTQSLRLESDFDTALAQQHVPVLLDKTSLMLLDSMACPAVAIEVAPLDANTPLTDAGYQQKILKALDAALVAWQSDWRSQP